MASSPHVLAISLPLQGHINPLIQLCHRLASKGIRVTYVTTASLSKNLEREAAGSCSHLISIESVPDSTADDEEEGLDKFEAFFRSFQATMTSRLSEIIAGYSNSGEPLTAIVYDSNIPWMLGFAHEKGLKGAMLFIQPAAVCSVIYHVWKGSLDISTYGDDSQISLPALPLMRVKDLPLVLYDVRGYQALLRNVVDQFSMFEKADWRLINTFDKLEDEVLKWMGKDSKIRTIGPTVPSMYTDRRIDGNYDYGLSLFKPTNDSCKKWLDLKDDGSVVYVSFGSLADLSEKQMEEVALGLIESKRNFLWVVRETERSKLPNYFASGPIERGLIVDWCMQLEVLSHPAVGCFFSHCGWNSTLEAWVLGVPMVAMPQWADQPTNAKLIADVWRTGVRVKADGNGIVMRDEIVACLNEVMERERGDEIKRNVLKWKGLAIEAVSEGGSSDQNIAEFADELLSAFRNIHQNKYGSDSL